MVCNNYLKHLRGSIQYKHTRTVYDPGYAWPRFALIRFQLKDRFVAIRFKQTTDSYLIRFLILAAFRFLGAPVDSIRFDSKRFWFFRFRTGSIPYVQRFRFLNRFGTILYIYIHRFLFDYYDSGWPILLFSQRLNCQASSCTHPIHTLQPRHWVFVGSCPWPVTSWFRLL